MTTAVPVHYIVDVAYPTQLFLSKLQNIIDPAIEQNSFPGYDSGHYSRTIHHVLGECATQVAEQLPFTDQEFYMHIINLPNMSLLHGVQSFHHPQRLAEFQNAFREWAVTVRSIILSRIPNMPHKYEYIVQTVTPKLISIAQYWFGSVEPLAYQDLINQL